MAAKYRSTNSPLQEINFFCAATTTTMKPGAMNLTTEAKVAGYTLSVTGVSYGVIAWDFMTNVTTNISHNFRTDETDVSLLCMSQKDIRKLVML